MPVSKRNPKRQRKLDRDRRRVRGRRPRGEIKVELFPSFLAVVPAGPPAHRPDAVRVAREAVADAVRRAFPGRAVAWFDRVGPDAVTRTVVADGPRLADVHRQVAGLPPDRLSAADREALFYDELPAPADRPYASFDVPELARAGDR